MDLNNYKGLLYYENPGGNFQDPATGAHFNYEYMCERLRRLQNALRTEAPTYASTSRTIAEGAALDEIKEEFLPPLIKLPRKSIQQAALNILNPQPKVISKGINATMSHPYQKIMYNSKSKKTCRHTIDAYTKKSTQASLDKLYKVGKSRNAMYSNKSAMIYLSGSKQIPMVPNSCKVVKGVTNIKYGVTGKQKKIFKSTDRLKNVYPFDPI